MLKLKKCNVLTWCLKSWQNKYEISYRSSVLYIRAVTLGDFSHLLVDNLNLLHLSANDIVPVLNYIIQMPSCICMVSYYESNPYFFIFKFIVVITEWDKQFKKKKIKIVFTTLCFNKTNMLLKLNFPLVFFFVFILSYIVFLLDRVSHVSSVHQASSFV